MQRLLYFLKKWRFFFLFLLLEAVGFALVHAQYEYHKSVVAALTGDLAFSAGRTVNSWKKFFTLDRENARLTAENAALRQMLSVDDKRMAGNPDTLAFGGEQAPYAYTAASIVRPSYSSPKNYMILDKGSSDGVEIDQGVVTGNGVLGVIVQTSANYSVCRSILHSDSHISARFKKNDYFGTVDWDGADRRFVKLVDIPRQAPVSPGDTVVTDRRSTLFPEGLPIGVVENAEVGDASDFYDIKVRLFDDLANLRYVYVLKYKYPAELEQISKGYYE